MVLSQDEGEKIRDYVNYINNEFANQYGRGYNSRFRREKKKKWLLNGMREEILEEMRSEYTSSDSTRTWPQIVQGAQDAEWLDDLRRRLANESYTRNDPVCYYRAKGYDFELDEDDFVRVFTDGACSRNGRPDAAAGIGVWFSDYNQYNLSEPLEEYYPTTNNVAEIVAVMKAIEIAKKLDISRLAVHTDSKYLINSVNNWMVKWLRNGWQKFEGGEIKHKDEYRELLSTMEDIDLKWVYVRGHGSSYGNTEADRLARLGAANY